MAGSDRLSVYATVFSCNSTPRSMALQQEAKEAGVGMGR